MPAPVVFDTIQPQQLPVSATVLADEDAPSTAQSKFGVESKAEPPHSASTAVLGAAVTASHYASGHEKVAKFIGLYVVRGPTDSRHVRYMMEVSMPQWNLRFRVAERFRSFRRLRQRLLKALKHCRGTGRYKSQQLGDNHNSPVMDDVSAGKELLRMIAERTSGSCSTCAVTRKLLSTMKFPKRKFVFTNKQDVYERTLVLEAFLGYCVELLTQWTGCARGRMIWAIILGEFLDVNLPACIRALPDPEKCDPMVDRATILTKQSTCEVECEEETNIAPVTPAGTTVPVLTIPQHTAGLDTDYEHTTDAIFSFISIDSSAPPLSSDTVRRA